MKKTTPIANRPSFSASAIFDGGYRIFFLSAALWAISCLAIWVAYISGLSGNWGSNIDMLQWHTHELVFGYGGAVVAGFALTAIPNWTGRKPVQGLLLAALFTPWLVARISAVSMFAGLSVEIQRAVSENLFYIMFLWIAAHEVIHGGNKRNYKVIALFSLLVGAVIYANLIRLEIFSTFVPGWKPGLAILLVLICVIGGRIIPAFTNNWMFKKQQPRKATMFNRFDALCITAAIVVLILYIAHADAILLARCAFVTACLHFIRLLRWHGWLTVSSPIVAILHVSYFWVPAGFLLLAMSGAGMIDETAAIHAWTIGGIGSTTLAVMSRASLGHAGLPLEDRPILTTIYTVINLAAAARIAAGSIWLDQAPALINISGILWCVAFLLFVVRFAPIHFAKQPD